MLEPAEVLLTGQWVSRDARIVADATCERILTLTRKYLVEIARDASGWEALYRDPADSRLWELTYPQGELHGGGPPQLRTISYEHAQVKYTFPSS